MSNEDLKKETHDVSLIYLQQVDLSHKSAKQIAGYYVQARKDIEKVLKEKTK